MKKIFVIFKIKMQSMGQKKTYVVYAGSYSEWEGPNESCNKFIVSLWEKQMFTPVKSAEHVRQKTKGALHKSSAQFQPYKKSHYYQN